MTATRPSSSFWAGADTDQASVDLSNDVDAKDTVAPAPVYPTPEKLTESLGGVWMRGYGMACCPAHDDSRPSLSIRKGDHYPVVWKCHVGCGQMEVLDALVEKGHWPATPPQNTAADPQTSPARARSLSRRPSAPANPYFARQAESCWQVAKPIKGTSAEQYLNNRGIVMDRYPDTLRFATHARHPNGPQQPAMIAKVAGVALPAVHRTFIDPAANPRKSMLGAVLGGHVELQRGGNGVLLVAEGLENALSVMAMGIEVDATVWSSLNAAGMAALLLPSLPGRLIIAPDIDRNKQAAGQRAAWRLGRRAEAMGWTVEVLVGLRPRQDFNDALLADAPTPLRQVPMHEFKREMIEMKEMKG